MSNIYEEIWRYEGGEMFDENEVAALFQQLIDTGLCWQLQGHYGRTAEALINEGWCTA